MMNPSTHTWLPCRTQPSASARALQPSGWPRPSAPGPADAPHGSCPPAHASGACIQYVQMCMWVKQLFNPVGGTCEWVLHTCNGVVQLCNQVEQEWLYKREADLHCRGTTPPARSG